MPTGTTRTLDTPVIPAATGGRSDAVMPQTNGTAPVPPTPQERMRQKLVEERREQAGQRQAPALPQGNDRPGHSPYYGGSHHTPDIPKENRALENQSINPSIKERPRRSTGPKEKPLGGAFVPKTRKSVEQAAQHTAAPVKASAATGKAPATKKVTERARKKAQREAQRKMLQRSQKATKAAADLSKRAVMATVNAVKALISRSFIERPNLPQKGCGPCPLPKWAGRGKAPLPYHNGETCHPLNRGFSQSSPPQAALPQSFRTQCEMLLYTYISRFSPDSLYQQRRENAVCQLRPQRPHTAVQGVGWERMPPLMEKSHTAAHKGKNFSSGRYPYYAEHLYDCQVRLFGESFSL